MTFIGLLLLVKSQCCFAIFDAVHTQRTTDRFGPLNPSNSHEALAPALVHNAGMRAKHNLYIVQLSKDALDEQRFIESHPGYVTGMPCDHVGMTGLDPDVRFVIHKAGIRSNE